MQVILHYAEVCFFVVIAIFLINQNTILTKLLAEIWENSVKRGKKHKQSDGQPGPTELTVVVYTQFWRGVYLINQIDWLSGQKMQ